MTEDNMSSQTLEAEYMDIVNRNAWTMVYQQIGRECQSYPYTCVEAKKPQNKPLNRYRDVNPYDHSRVILERSDVDYINANLVKVERARRKYILTQGPLMATVSHFWLMVWEQNSRAILMLNKIIEKNENKCYWYWPHDCGDSHKMILDDVGLTLEQLSETDCRFYSTRVFKLVDTASGEAREVIQYHYTTWPDFGVPTSPVAFLEFLLKVRASGALEPDVGPAIVHCSAGIGRSGTFCLVDSCLVIIEKEGLEGVEVQKILLEMRRDRMGLIQTPDQLRFSYQAIIEGAKRLQSGYKPEDTKGEESIYWSVCDEEAAPPPPPRGESLPRPPARPLPAIPNSASCGNLPFPDGEEDEEESSTEDSLPPTPPGRSPSTSPSSDEQDTQISQETVAESGDALRRRRNRELADRVSSIKKRQRDAERWHALKRSLYKPLTITFGVLLAGILIYTYVKH